MNRKMIMDDAEFSNSSDTEKPSVEEIIGKFENFIEESHRAIIEKMILARPDIHPICKI
jgi:hypothetical protein